MLGDFIYSADVNDTAYKYVAPVKFEKAVKRFLLLAVVFVSGGLIWIFCISPCMVPVKTNVKSFQGLSKAEVLNIAGIDAADAYVSVNAAEAEWLLSNHYLVGQARVVKRFPDRLSIFLEPRQPVALSYVRVNGRTQPVYFDKHGIVTGIGIGAGEAPPVWLPIVSGVFDEGDLVQPGIRLPSMYLPLFSRIEIINDEDPVIWKAVSEVKIARKDNDLFDLVLYPVHNTIKLRMRSDISKDSIYYALLMLDVYRQLGDNVPEELDVRSGIGVVNAQEVRFGK